MVAVSKKKTNAPKAENGIKAPITKGKKKGKTPDSLNKMKETGEETKSPLNTSQKIDSQAILKVAEGCRNRKTMRKHRRRMKMLMGDTGTNNTADKMLQGDASNTTDLVQEQKCTETSSDTTFVVVSNAGTIELNDPGTKKLLKVLSKASNLSLCSPSLHVTCKDEVAAKELREAVMKLAQHKKFTVKEYKEKKPKNMETSESVQ